MLRKILMFIAVAAVAGCAGKKAGQVTVSAASTASTKVATAAPTSLPMGVTVTEIDVAVKKFELDEGTCAAALAKATSDGTTPPSDGSDCEAELGPFVAQLDQAALADLAAGKLPQVWTGTLQAGTYTELAVSICSFDASELADPTQAPLLASMGGASIVVKGTFMSPTSETTVPFTIPVDACEDLERHVNVTVDSTGSISNLTFNLDIASWFYDKNGNPLAPDTADGAAAIAANIAASLDVFEDDDHDGMPD